MHAGQNFGHQATPICGCCGLFCVICSLGPLAGVGLVQGIWEALVEAQRDIETGWDTTCELKVGDTYSLMAERGGTGDVEVHMGDQKHGRKMLFRRTFCPITLSYASDTWHEEGTVQGEVFAGGDFVDTDAQAPVLLDPQTKTVEDCAKVLSRSTWHNVRLFPKGSAEPPASEDARGGWACGDFGYLQCYGPVTVDNCKYYKHFKNMTGGHSQFSSQPALMDSVQSVTDAAVDAGGCLAAPRPGDASLNCAVGESGQVYLGTKKDLFDQMEVKIGLAKKAKAWLLVARWLFTCIALCCCCGAGIPIAFRMLDKPRQNTRDISGGVSQPNPEEIHQPLKGQQDAESDSDSSSNSEP